MNKFVTVVLAFAIMIPTLAFAQEENKWVNLDRTGLYKSTDDGQIVRHLWKGYSQAEAIALLDKLPNRLQSPAYREMVKRVLLSESRADTREDITSPALLAKRIQLLIDYGLFDDARALYGLAVEKNTLPDDFDLALIGLQFSMLDGDIAPICLDIEAMSMQFRDMSGWKELSNFCQLRFGSNEKISVDSTSFKVFPVLRDMLIFDSIDFENDMSSFEILALFADSKISDDAYNAQARNLSKVPDIAITLASGDAFKNFKTYQCYAIESAKRGLIDSNALKAIYADLSFSDDILNHSGGEISLHPCDIPAYFYQRLQKDDLSAEDKHALTSLMLNISDDIPAIAFTPMATHFDGLDIISWRKDIVLGLAGNDIPDSNMPLHSIQKSNQLDKKDYEEWLNTPANTKMIQSNNNDTAEIVHISHIISGDLNNLQNKTRKLGYENFFILTYAEKSLSLGLGFNDFVAKAYSDDDYASSLIHTLSALGEYDPQDVHVHDIAVILSALKAYKLEKNAITLAFEYLQ